MEKYRKNNPIVYINKKLKKELNKNYIEEMYRGKILDSIDGWMVSNINNLIINNKDIVIGEVKDNKEETMIFSPLISKDE